VPQPGLSHYLRLLRRNLWIVILTLALATAVAVYVSHRQSKLYRSSADVFLGSQSVASAVTGAPLGADPVRTATTQAALAHTAPVAERALRLAAIDNRSPDELLANSTVTPAANADILTFSVKDRNPRIAEKLADDYALAYTRYRHDLETTALTKARESLDKQLAELRRARLQRTTAYADLADKAQQLSTLEVLQGTNVPIRSAGAATQIQPRPVRNTAIAAALGLLLGLGLVLLREALNTRVRSAAEVQERLDLPQLARIPEPARRFRGPRLVMLDDPYGQGAEPYRILATNLDFVNLEHGARTIMITSAKHGDGKSTTVANLALAFARSGRRTILADLHFRKPALDHLFDLGDGHGATSVALRRVDLNDALVPIALVAGSKRDGRSNQAVPGSLEVLPVGPIPPNPAEFAGSHALAEILAELKKRADLVLIDAPPLLDISDAMTLTSRVDGLVVVTKLPDARRAELQELHRVLATAPATKLGFVVTGVISEREVYVARQTAAESQFFSESAAR
jgi:capsular exopolysaccharide synthesis family protein